LHPSSAIFAAAGVLGCVLAGCSVNSGGSNVPRASKRALQEDIAERLADAGDKPESVTCKQDLLGELGASARCDVVVTATNSFEPIVTVTGADGAAIEYKMTPALSRHQLEQTVSRIIAGPGDLAVNEVSCESGMAGTVGA
jgi:Domain of unknown function (DUF4333)